MINDGHKPSLVERFIEHLDAYEVVLYTAITVGLIFSYLLISLT